MEKPTSRQTWALFCISGYDVRNTGLTFSAASGLISLSKINKEQTIKTISELPGAVLKKKVAETNNVDFGALYQKAHEAGMVAVEKLQVQPMVVEGHANPLDDSSAVVESYYVPDGPCGFAWINVKPGNSPFANYLKKNELARADSYSGGVCIWVHQFNQSIQKKDTYATAFASVLGENGIKAYAGSRMD